MQNSTALFDMLHIPIGTVKVFVKSKGKIAQKGSVRSPLLFVDYARYEDTQEIFKWHTER